ncbi:MAG: GtrA family protein [Bacteroidaceae bacterium]|nr:GtrA family protein [Bacteroidaceae bacterium]
MNVTIKQFVKFVTVGCICTFTDMALFYAVRTLFSYQVSMIIGYLSSLVLNYLLTIYWTFETTSSAKNAVAIVCAHLINLFVIRMSLMYIFVQFASLNDRTAFIPTLILSSILNFFIIKKLIHG